MPEEVKVNTSASVSDSAALHEEYGAHLPDLGDGAEKSEPAEGRPTQVISEAKPPKSPNGNLVLALGLIGLCLAGVATMAYLGYQSQQQADQYKVTAQAQIASLQRQLNEANAKLAEAENKSRTAKVVASLKLTEFGVQFPLPDGLTDVSYAKLLPGQGAEIIGFTSASLVTACGTVSKCAPAQAPLGSLSRFTQAKRPSGGYTGGKLLATVGGYDYVYSEGSKLTKPAAAANLQTSQSTTLQTAITQLSLIK